MTTETLTTVSRPSEDALCGIGLALSHFEQAIAEAAMGAEEAGLPYSPPADMLCGLRAAQGWLMQIQHELHLDDVANDR